MIIEETGKLESAGVVSMSHKGFADCLFDGILRIMSPPSKTGYYGLTKEDRNVLKERIADSVKADLGQEVYGNVHTYSSDDDTYIRKNVYLAIGKLYRTDPKQRDGLIAMLGSLYLSEDEKVRQTVVYALGEIGKIDFEAVRKLLGDAFFDGHHSVLNAVTGALKQLGEKNPKPTIEFVKKHLPHADPKTRVKLLHGLELRGRTHPDDVLPVLSEYQNDTDRKVIETIIHILGQISYKKGCLEIVTGSLKEWNNSILVKKALTEIVDVHENYRKFSFFSPEGARDLIKQKFGDAFPGVTQVPGV